MTLGKNAGDVSDNIIGIAAFAFAFLAIGSTYAILGNNVLLRKATPWLRKLALHDLDHTAFLARADAKPRRHLSARFFVDRQFAARGDRAQPARLDSRNRA